MNTSINRFLIALLVLAALTQSARATVALAITPATVSNTYSGQITLQINGLTNAEPVILQKFLDLDANGTIEGGDLLVQQFTLTDGQAGMVIGGVTNSNVPGDLDGPNGIINAKLNFQNEDFAPNVAGRYLYMLSSPQGHFLPVTASFVVTNFPFSQEIAGMVLSNNTSVPIPNAVVLLFEARAGHNGPGNLLAGAVADSTGAYAVPMPPGTYMPMVFGRNGVFNYSARPPLALTSGQNLVTNLTLISATSTIAGSMVDSGHPSLGLPGVVQPATTTNGLVAFAFSDASGNFDLPATPGQWRLASADWGQVVHGYMGWNKGTNVIAPATGVTLAYPKATALFYGRVKDTAGRPLPGVAIEASDKNGFYSCKVYTDINGDYSVGVVGGFTNDSWELSVQTDFSPTNYLYSAFRVGSQPTYFSADTGQAALHDFVGMPAINRINGSLKDSNGNPIPGVQMLADAMNDPNNFAVSAYTDTNGNFSLNVGNDTWDVGVFSGFPAYLVSPGDQWVTISNNNAIVNFVSAIATQHITGSVADTNGNPAVGVKVGANNGQNFVYQTATTDAAGRYSLNVANGTWTVGVDNDLGFPGNCLGLAEQTVMVSDNNPVANLVVARATQQITGLVQDNYGSPIAGVAISAYAAIDGVYEISVYTDQLGHYTLYVANSTWTVGLAALPAGYQKPPDQAVEIANNDGVLNFTASLLSAPKPSLSLPVKPANGQFQFCLNGVAGQNYTVQVCTNLNLTNWTTLFSTNSGASGAFTVIDAAATNQQRFYRVVLQP